VAFYTLQDGPIESNLAPDTERKKDRGRVSRLLCHATKKISVKVGAKTIPCQRHS